VVQTACCVPILKNALYTSPGEEQGKFVRIFAFCSRIRYAYRLWEEEKTYLFERENGFGKNE
jgi:hypothetical protein